MSSSAPERRSTRNRGKLKPNYNDRDLTVVNQDGSRTVHQIAARIILQEDNSDEAVLSRMKKSINPTDNLATVEMKYDYTYYNESKSDSVEDDLDLDRFPPDDFQDHKYFKSEMTPTFDNNKQLSKEDKKKETSVHSIAMAASSLSKPWITEELWNEVKAKKKNGQQWNKDELKQFYLSLERRIIMGHTLNKGWTGVSAINSHSWMMMKQSALLFEHFIKQSTSHSYMKAELLTLIHTQNFWSQNFIQCTVKHNKNQQIQANEQFAPSSRVKKQSSAVSESAREENQMEKEAAFEAVEQVWTLWWSNLITKYIHTFLPVDQQTLKAINQINQGNLQKIIGRIIHFAADQAEQIVLDGNVLARIDRNDLKCQAEKLLELKKNEKERAVHLFFELITYHFLFPLFEALKDRLAFESVVAPESKSDSETMDKLALEFNESMDKQKPHKDKMKFTRFHDKQNGMTSEVNENKQTIIKTRTKLSRDGIDQHTLVEHSIQNIQQLHSFDNLRSRFQHFFKHYIAVMLVVPGVSQNINKLTLSSIQAGHGFSLSHCPLMQPDLTMKYIQFDEIKEYGKEKLDQKCTLLAGLMMNYIWYKVKFNPKQWEEKQVKKATEAASRSRADVRERAQMNLFKYWSNKHEMNQQDLIDSLIKCSEWFRHCFWLGNQALINSDDKIKWSEINKFALFNSSHLCDFLCAWYKNKPKLNEGKYEQRISLHPGQTFTMIPKWKTEELIHYQLSENEIFRIGTWFNKNPDVNKFVNQQDKVTLTLKSNYKKFLNLLPDCEDKERLLNKGIELNQEKLNNAKQQIINLVAGTQNHPSKCRESLLSLYPVLSSKVGGQSQSKALTDILHYSLSSNGVELSVTMKKQSGTAAEEKSTAKEKNDSDSDFAQAVEERKQNKSNAFEIHLQDQQQQIQELMLEEYEKEEDDQDGWDKIIIMEEDDQPHQSRAADSEQECMMDTEGPRQRKRSLTNVHSQEIQDQMNKNKKPKQSIHTYVNSLASRSIAQTNLANWTDAKNYNLIDAEVQRQYQLDDNVLKEIVKGIKILRKDNKQIVTCDPGLNDIGCFVVWNLVEFEEKTEESTTKRQKRVEEAWKQNNGLDNLPKRNLKRTNGEFAHYHTQTLRIKVKAEWQLDESLVKSDSIISFLMIPVRVVEVSNKLWKEVCGYSNQANRQERRRKHWSPVKQFYNENRNIIFETPGGRDQTDPNADSKALLTAIQWQIKMEEHLWNDRLTIGRRSAELEIVKRSETSRAISDLVVELFGSEEKAKAARGNWVFVLGDGDFHVPGYETTPTRRFLDDLKSTALSCILVNECYTSKLSCCCHSLNQRAERYHEDVQQVITEWTTMHCPRCRGTMQRDVNANFNMAWKFMDLNSWDYQEKSRKISTRNGTFDRLTQEALTRLFKEEVDSFKEDKKKNSKEENKDKKRKKRKDYRAAKKRKKAEQQKQLLQSSEPPDPGAAVNQPMDLADSHEHDQKQDEQPPPPPLVIVFDAGMTMKQKKKMIGAKKKEKKKEQKKSRMDKERSQRIKLAQLHANAEWSNTEEVYTRLSGLKEEKEKMKAAVEEIQASKEWIEHEDLLRNTVEMVEKAQNHVKKLRPILQRKAGEIVEENDETCWV